MIKDLHEVQASILKKLLFNNGSHFSALNSLEIDSNHFNFHLKEMVKLGFIEKKDSLYYLTQLGKQHAGMLDTDTLKFERIGKITVAVWCKRDVNGKVEYLMQQRLKEPFFEWWGNISGKVRFGNTTEETAIRELEEEAGLSGEPIFLGIRHSIKGSSPTEPTLDNYFFNYLFINPIGELISTPEGRNLWMVEEEITKLEHRFHGFDEYLQILKSEKVTPYKETFTKVDSI